MRTALYHLFLLAASDADLSSKSIFDFRGADLFYRKRSILGIVQNVQPEDAYFLGCAADYGLSQQS